MTFPAQPAEFRDNMEVSQFARWIIQILVFYLKLGICGTLLTFLVCAGYSHLETITAILANPLISAPLYAIIISVAFGSIIYVLSKSRHHNASTVADIEVTSGNVMYGIHGMVAVLEHEHTGRIPLARRETIKVLLVASTSAAISLLFGAIVTPLVAIIFMLFSSIHKLEFPLQNINIPTLAVLAPLILGIVGFMVGAVIAYFYNLAMYITPGPEAGADAEKLGISQQEERGYVVKVRVR